MHVRVMRAALTVLTVSLLVGCDGAPSLEGSATAATLAPVVAPSPSSRTPMPTAAEWRAAAPADIGGARAMGCDGRRVREWIRVACAGASDSGGRPTTVQVSKGERVFALATDGSTSAVFGIVEGAHAEVDFAWTDRSSTLLVEWKKGEPQPVTVARFVGNAPRLDATSGAGEHRACSCFREITEKATCDDMVVVNPSLDECAATYQDCLEVLECAAGKSKKWPKCPMGKGNLPPFGTCAAQCGDGKPACPAGTSCNLHVGGLCQ